MDCDICCEVNALVNNGKEYEKLTQAVFSYVNNKGRELADTISVLHDVTLQGKDTTHQIDVFWEFKVGVRTHKVIIQAKELRRKVSKSQMLTFKGVIDDMPGVVGIFVTNTGYDKGAIEIAKANNIDIYELRKSKDGDWDGFIKTVTVDMTVVCPFIENFRIIVDEQWAQSNNIQDFSKFPIFSGDCEIAFSNNEGRKLSDIFNKLCLEIGVGREKRAIKYEDNTLLKTSCGLTLQIQGFQGEFGNRELKNTFTIDSGDFIDHVLKNVSNGETQMLNKYFIEFERHKHQTLT